MTTSIVMPRLGESIVEGTVGKWFKKPGDTIELYEPVMEVVTDKVTTEIPSPAAGTLLQILVPEGSTVNAGTALAVIGNPGETVEPPQAEGKKSATQAGLDEAQEIANLKVPPSAVEAPSLESASAIPARTTTQEGDAKNDGGKGLRLTPVVARMLGEFNITDEEFKSINGSGEGGRVSKKDLENFLKTRGIGKPERNAEIPAWEQPGTGELFRPSEETVSLAERAKIRPVGKSPAPQSVPQTPAQSGVKREEEELVPLSQMRRTIADHMLKSKQIAPHVTTIHEADMTRVIEHMRTHQDEFTRQGARLTYTPYFVQAAIAALHEMPIVNAQFTDQGILMKRALNIGIAVAIDDGLIVPVIVNADEKSLIGLARSVNDLAVRAREKKLIPDEVLNGTFTVTNYGIFGSLFGTPIIPQPQSAILGVGAIQKRVVVINDAIAIRPMVYLGLTFDHRLLDGAIGDQFMTKVKGFLENYQGV